MSVYSLYIMLVRTALGTGYTLDVSTHTYSVGSTYTHTHTQFDTFPSFRHSKTNCSSFSEIEVDLVALLVSWSRACVSGCDWMNIRSSNNRSNIVSAFTLWFCAEHNILYFHNSHSHIHENAKCESVRVSVWKCIRRFDGEAADAAFIVVSHVKWNFVCHQICFIGSSSWNTCQIIDLVFNGWMCEYEYPWIGTNYYYDATHQAASGYVSLALFMIIHVSARMPSCTSFIPVVNVYMASGEFSFGINALLTSNFSCRKMIKNWWNM